MNIFEKTNLKLKTLISEYGSIALWTYIAIFAVAFFGFHLAIKSGFEVDGVTAEAGSLGAAYIATKATLPLRVGLAVVLTPIVARFLKRTTAH